MNIYTVSFTETIVHYVDVEAPSEADAQLTAEHLVANCSDKVWSEPIGTEHRETNLKDN